MHNRIGPEEQEFRKGCFMAGFGIFSSAKWPNFAPIVVVPVRADNVIAAGVSTGPRGGFDGPDRGFPRAQLGVSTGQIGGFHGPFAAANLVPAYVFGRTNRSNRSKKRSLKETSGA